MKEVLVKMAEYIAVGTAIVTGYLAAALCGI